MANNNTMHLLKDGQKIITACSIIIFSWKGTNDVTKVTCDKCIHTNDFFIQLQQAVQKRKLKK